MNVRRGNIDMLYSDVLNHFGIEWIFYSGF